MSFWINTTDYTPQSENGEEFLNVSGVPGGNDDHDPTRYPVMEALQQGLAATGGLVTNEVADAVISAFVDAETDSLTPANWLRETVRYKRGGVWFSATDEELEARLEADDNDWPTHPHKMQDFDPDRDLDCPGAFYLCRWLLHSIGKRVAPSGPDEDRYASF